MDCSVTYWTPPLLWIRCDWTLPLAPLLSSLSRPRFGKLRPLIAGRLKITLHNIFFSLDWVLYHAVFFRLLISPLVPLYPYINSWFRTSAHPTLLTAPSFLLPFTFPLFTWSCSGVRFQMENRSFQVTVCQFYLQHQDLCQSFCSRFALYSCLQYLACRPPTLYCCDYGRTGF